MIRELQRELPPEKLMFWQNELELFKQVIAQKRNDKNKVGLIATSKTLIITSIKTFEGNPHNSKTIESLMDQLKKNKLNIPSKVVYNRGGKGQRQIGNTIVSTPDNKPLKRDSKWYKNYLHGAESPQINAFLAAAGWNIKKMMRKLSKNAKTFIFHLLSFIFCLKSKIQNLKSKIQNLKSKI